MQSTDDLDLRQQALGRIKKKQEFLAHLVAYVLVNAMIVAIWATTSGGFFWPIFPIIGWGIGLIFHGLEVYRVPPSEEQIQREMDRLRR